MRNVGFAWASFGGVVMYVIGRRCFFSWVNRQKIWKTVKIICGLFVRTEVMRFNSFWGTLSFVNTRFRFHGWVQPFLRKENILCAGRKSDWIRVHILCHSYSHFREIPYNASQTSLFRVTETVRFFDNLYLCNHNLLHNVTKTFLKADVTEIYFRRLRIVAKSRHVSPSVCSHVSARLLLDRFLWNFILGTV
jgi:hypothetical protein